MICSSSYLNAQDAFIEVITEADLNLDSTEIQLFDAINSNPLNAQVYPVDIGILADFQDNGILTFNLPNQSTTYSATPISIEAYTDTEYIWYGSLIGLQEGTVLITAKDNRTEGRITVNNEVYLVQSVGIGKHVLIDVDETKFTVDESSLLESNDSTSVFTEPQIDVRTDCSALPIRVLILYTPAAADVCSPSSVANLAMAQLKNVISNSEISSNCLRFSLVGVEPLDFVESSSLRDDAIELNLSNTQVALDARNLREQFEADLVVVFTDGNYGGTFGGAFLGGTANSPERAISIVEIDAAVARITFAHEVGHLLGGEHQQCDLYLTSSCSTTAGPDHGHGWGDRNWFFCKWKNYSTVLHQIRDDNTRLEYYSNPDVEYSGKATGVVGIRDNAGVFTNSGCTIANYRDFTPPLSVFISGVSLVDESGNYTWTAQVSNGSAPYTYQWGYSDDGFNYIQAGNASSLTMFVDGTPEKLYLRLDVQDDAGDMVTAFHQVVYIADGCSPCLQGEGSSSLIASSNESTISIQPNPAINRAKVLFEVDENEEGNVELILSDQNGKILKRIPQGYLKKGRYISDISFDNIVSGIHILKVQKRNRVETTKVIITK